MNGNAGVVSVENVGRLLVRSLTIALLPLMAGCAYGTRHVTLVYPPEQPDVSRTIRPAAESVPPAGTQQPIVLVRFADRRAEKQAIGEVRGTLFRTADVVTDSNVADWVSQALKRELEGAGYSVTVVDTAPLGGGAILSGEVLSVYCTALLFYEARVSFSARITKDGKEILKGRYRGEGSAGSNWAAAAESYSHSLSLALGEATGRLVSDLNSLFFTTVR
jgi:hypothetical protein